MAEAVAMSNGDALELGLADSIKLLMRCSICLERFTTPKCLPCQHTFCEACLESVLINNNYIHQVPCPQCGTVHTLSRGTIRDLPNNLTVVGLMDISLVAADEGNGSATLKCAECATETIQSDLSCCPHCDGVLCASCSMSHSSRIRDALLISAQHLHGYVEHTFDARNKLGADLHTSQQNSEAAKTEIKEHVDRVILKLREREKSLIQHVDGYARNTSSHLQLEIVRLETELAKAVSVSASVDSELAKVLSNAESGIASLMALSAQCSEYNNPDYQNLPSNVQERTNLNINFVPLKTEELSQGILDFGEITTESSATIVSIGEESSSAESVSVSLET